MTKNSLIDLILKVLPMNPVRAVQVAERFRLVDIERNTFLLKAGAVCNASCFVESGIMRAYIYDMEGKEVTTAFFSANSYATDLLSFFKRTPAREYIQAVTDCRTWSISYEDMQASFHAIPEFREFGRLNIVQQYSLLKERMLSNLQEPAEKRYSDLVQSHPEILQQVPLKYIASYLGIADTSLSRIRKDFVKK